MKKTNETSKTTREQALEWWNGLSVFESGNKLGKNGLCTKYYHIDRYYDSLTGREIEEIWRHEHYLEPINSKLNQKQFKDFDPRLFKQYIDKFSDEDQLKIFDLLSEILYNKGYKEEIYRIITEG